VARSHDFPARPDRSLRADNNDATDAKEPIENAERAEPMEPIDSTEPMEPIERNEFLQPMQRNEPSDLIDHREPLAAMGQSLPHQPPPSPTGMD
jgi:hypothetical protein